MTTTILIALSVLALGLFYVGRSYWAWLAPLTPSRETKTAR